MLTAAKTVLSERITRFPRGWVRPRIANLLTRDLWSTLTSQVTISSGSLNLQPQTSPRFNDNRRPISESVGAISVTVLNWVCRENIEYLDLTQDRLEMNPAY